ncbi:MAG: M23 family metallopeptidase [Ignavibacteriaceae bacterium]|nr:M23 family metallopeptidase [Ignavibacteriaceae bacterium]
MKRLLEKIKLLNKKFRKFLEYTILLVPDISAAESRTYKVRTPKVLIAFTVYSIIVFFLGFFIITNSPISDLLSYRETNLSSEDNRRLEEISERVNFLLAELERLKSVNSKLKYAIMLGDSTLIDSIMKNNKKEDSIVPPKEGNVFKLFFLFIQKVFASQSNDLILIKPVLGYISRGFEPEKGHMGIDFVVKTNTPVVAPADGYVVFSDYTVDDGYKMILSHSGNVITIYKHCSLLLKKEREKVIQGEMIALSGNTGEKTSGPHLHFEVWINNKPVNPQILFINDQGE